MRRTRFVRFPCVVVVVIAILLASLGTAQAASVSGCGGWSIIPNPNPGTNSNNFSGVAAASANDAWAVGSYDNLSNTRQLGLIEHWNGKAWVVKKSPEPSQHFNNLNAVAAIASNDVWAVGDYKTTNVRAQTLAEHWDGTAWSVVSSPNSGTAINDFYGISADASNDVWAVGFYNNIKSTEQTLVEHWDGSSWSVVPSLNEGSGNNVLYSVTAISPTDVWVVGSGSGQPQIEYWNGSNWTIVPSAAPKASSYNFYTIAAVSPNDIWTAGGYTKGIYEKTLIEHWDGSKWSIVRSPNPGSFLNGLESLAVNSVNNIWAVGSYLNSGSNPFQTLTEHWNGTAWSVVSSPNAGSGNNLLYGVTGVPGTGDAWTVGDIFYPSGVQEGLTEFYC